MSQLTQQIPPALNEAKRAVEDKTYDQIILTVKSIQNASNSHLITLKKSVQGKCGQLPGHKMLELMNKIF